MFALEQLIASQMIDRAVFRRAHEPGGGIVGNAGLRPLFQRRDKGVLSQIFGNAHVPDDACETADDAGGFDAPDGVDDAVNIGGRHGPRSHHR